MGDATSNKICEFIVRLLRWHCYNKQDFPWRSTRNPYVILVTELLLRKTTRKQVKGVFEKFFSTYRSANELATANLRDLKRIIKPLGMEHKRARGLKALANIIVDTYNGKIPRERSQLLKLPNVGPYATNAVLCFAYGKDEPLVDTNMVRVLTRVFSISASRKRPATDPKIWAFASKILPRGKAKEFNSAVLDLAASLCRPSRPKCSICPVLSICDYGQTRRLNVMIK